MPSLRQVPPRAPRALHSATATRAKIEDTGVAGMLGVGGRRLLRVLARSASPATKSLKGSFWPLNSRNPKISCSFRRKLGPRHNKPNLRDIFHFCAPLSIVLFLDISLYQI